MNECTHTLDYQLMDEGQKTTKGGATQKNIRFSELWTHGLECRTSSTYFFQTIHAERQDWQGLDIEWGTLREHSCCDLLVQQTSAISGSQYLEEGNTTDLEDYHKVANILKELANAINMK